MSDFDKAFPIILEFEGGYDNDPNDPGGETKYGICKRNYPHLDIKNLTVEQAKEIYRKDYWDAVKCNVTPWPFNLVLFDTAVNQGQGIAPKLLQKAVGVTEDGKIGSVTINACNNAGIDKIVSFLVLRALRYAQTKNFERYGRGWMTRIFTLMTKL